MLDELAKEIQNSEATEELYETLIALKVVAGRMAEHVLEKIRIQAAIDDFQK